MFKDWESMARARLVVKNPNTRDKMDLVIDFGVLDTVFKSNRNKIELAKEMLCTK